MTFGSANELAWRRGRWCDGGACVEVATVGEVVMMRSSADPDIAFTVSRDEWRDFLAGAKDGLFDEL
jgi:hypothetical protein